MALLPNCGWFWRSQRVTRLVMVDLGKLRKPKVLDVVGSDVSANFLLLEDIQKNKLRIFFRTESQRNFLTFALLRNNFFASFTVKVDCFLFDKRKYGKILIVSAVNIYTA
jgi:hypothetical protein